MVVWLASYPRSGNTYLRLLLRQLYGVNTYSLYDDKELAEQDEICQLIGHQTRPSTIEEMMCASDIYFVKTHELPTENDNSPAIYLVRDGRDVLMSYAHYIQIYAPQLVEKGYILVYVCDILGDDDIIIIRSGYSD